MISAAAQLVLLSARNSLCVNFVSVAATAIALICNHGCQQEPNDEPQVWKDDDDDEQDK